MEGGGCRRSNERDVLVLGEPLEAGLRLRGAGRGPTAQAVLAPAAPVRRRCP